MSNTKSKLIVAVIVSFFIFQLFLFVKSFPAEYNIYLRYLGRLETGDLFWASFWFASELVGEAGLAVRFVGACFALVFAWVFARRDKVVFSPLRKAVLFEGAYYLFNIPFIVSLLVRPNTSIVNLEAGLSYALQIVLVSPSFFVLYSEMRKPDSNVAQLYRWSAIAVIGSTLALWVKHFLMNLYALPISLNDPILLAGFLNSTLTMLLASVLLTVAFLSVIGKRKSSFSYGVVGAGFLLVGVYFVIYVVISLLNQGYSSFLGLTELWAIAFVIPGVGFLAKTVSVAGRAVR